MGDFYWVLDILIREELDKGQMVAIYPFGRIGLQAKDILYNRYGHKGIIIDNILGKYNPEVIDINEFKIKDNSTITIILCTTDRALNNRLYDDLIKMNIKAQIKNILDVPLVQHPEKKAYFEQVKRTCQIRKVEGFELVRVGGSNDGGYIMLDDFRDCSIAYSFGIGKDISWDKSMAERGIDVYCYDHTIECIPERNENLHFNKIGISGVDCQEGNMLTMESILYNNNHRDKENLILKMDVEGAEWEFIESISSETLKRFSQMTFELHRLTGVENGERIIAALEKINRTHQVVWIHANNANRAEKAGDIVVPELLEITYVTREKYTFVPTEYNCPLDIDAPNLKERFDLKLLNWG